MNGNSWIDLPVVEAMDYFGGIIAVAFKWATRYGLLIGTIGLCWSAFKVMMSRMTVKDLWWDTLFKWCGFVLMIAAYPTMTTAFMNLGNEIGMKAGGGKQVIIDGLKQVRDSIRYDLKESERIADDLEAELSSKFEGLVLTTQFQNNETMSEYLSKISDEVQTFKFKKNSDRDYALQMINDVKEADKYKVMFSRKTLASIEKVLRRRNIKGEWVDDNSDLTNTYLDLDIYLKDSEQRDTYYISSASLLRVALLSCQIMWEKENLRYKNIQDDIESRHGGLLDVTKHIESFGAFAQHLWQMVMCLFCCFTLILATIFASIQYVMTILEYTIIVGIGAIFIPLMLFDGTKDIPKKLIPVFTSFMVKVVVITICLMFVYYLMLQNAVNTIADDGGMTWPRVAEVSFEAILAYVLTQNAPKIAQTILTGQPQLSMGEALQAGGTALGTAVAMKQAPGAAVGAAAKLGNKGIDAAGGISKMHHAASTVRNGLGPNASTAAKIKGTLGAYGAVAGGALKERTKAKLESAARKPGTGFSVLDKALQAGGFIEGGAGGSGGAGGGSPAFMRNGQSSEGNSLNNQSNSHSRTATTTDQNTKQTRNMTTSEFMKEKASQGDSIGQARLKKIQDAQNKKKGSSSGNNGNNESESITNGTRVNN
ncbi:MAG: type IV secretion system protein [Treponema sp.]|nr:type IV secretion system protein [Treponema sp.]